MKLRVHCDGETTTVIDDDTGDDITKYVYKVEWQHTHGKRPTAMVTFTSVALDYVGEARANTQAIVEKDSLAG